MLVNAVLATALCRAGATPAGVDLLTQHLGKRVVLAAANGKYSVQILQADGKTPMAGTTFADLMTEAAESWPSLFTQQQRIITMPVSQALKQRWNAERLDKHPLAAMVRKHFHGVLDVHDRIEAKRSELAADKTLSDIGRRQKLTEWQRARPNTSPRRSVHSPLRVTRCVTSVARSCRRSKTRRTSPPHHCGRRSAPP